MIIFLVRHLSVAFFHGHMESPILNRARCTLVRGDFMNRILALGCLTFFLGLKAGAQKIEPIKAQALVEHFKEQQGVVVINFWSTWCKPCIDEIPGFVNVYDSMKSKGVQLWLVSQDTRDLFYSGKLKNYISKKDGWARANLFWFNETNADYYCPIIDSEWSGVIPATLIVHPGKGYSKFLEESMSADRLLEEIGLALQ